MKIHKHKAAGALALLLALGSGAALAAEQTYRFTQTGFSGGGTLQGFFVGEDHNHDGAFTLFHGEVRSFSLGFSGDAQVGDFTLGIDNLRGLVWRIGTPRLGDEVVDKGIEGIASAPGAGPFSFASGLGPLGEIGGQAIELASGRSSLTAQAIAIAAVPEPSIAALLLAGIGVLGTLALRRHRG